MSQAPLITRRDLLNHGADSGFLAQFALRQIEVECVTAGALGVASFAWRFVGDSLWSAAEVSEAGSTWTWEAPDPSWASLTFAAHSYADGNAWTVSTSGTVTPQAGAPSTVTATRADIVAATIASGTSDAVTWMQPRVVPPVVSLGEGQKGWLAVICIYRLKSRQGMTPAQAGSGDENLRARALDAESNFRAIGASAQRPPDIVDSSDGGTGAGLSLLPLSDPLRGW